MNDHDGRSIFISCLASMPDAAGSTAAQWLHSESQLVSGLERLARPAVPPKAVGAVAFEIPDHRQRVLAGNLQCDERMRVGEFELPNDADQLNRMFPIEHNDGVVPDRPIARHNEPRPKNQGGESCSQGACYRSGTTGRVDSAWGRPTMARCRSARRK